MWQVSVLCRRKKESIKNKTWLDWHTFAMLHNTAAMPVNCEFVIVFCNNTLIHCSCVVVAVHLMNTE